jgi:uncharacterized protein YkwD
MPPAAHRHLSGAAIAAAATLLSLTVSTGSTVPSPAPRPQAAARDKVIDFRSIPSAQDYRTDAPKGPGFVGSDAAVLTRSLARINQALGTALSPDGRLARLARWIYDHLGPERSMPQQSALDLLGSRLGLAEPLPNILVVQAPDAPRLANTVTARLAQVFDLTGYTHIGGVAEYEEDSSVVVVIVLSGRHLELAPVPRRLAAPGQVCLAGRLLGPYAKPQLAHTLPSGETRLSALSQDRDFRTTIDLAAMGRHRLEIIAEGPEGPSVVANFPVYVGIPVDESVERAAAPPRRAPSADEVEDRLLGLINADREKAGVGALDYDPALALAARLHSEDMRDHDFVAHISPTTGSAEDRLHAAGIATSLAAECVGKGYSPDEIHEGFMDSPGHRAATLLPGATHVGVGVVTAKEDDRTTYYVTELFIRRIPTLGPDAKTIFLTAFNSLRAASGAPELVGDADLGRAADETAREFLGNEALTEKQVLEHLQQRLVRLEFKGRTLTAVLSVVDSLKEEARRAAADPKGGRARGLGLGIAQGTRRGLPPNSIVLVLIYVE